MNPKWACGVPRYTRTSVMAYYVYYRDWSWVKSHVGLKISGSGLGVSRCSTSELEGREWGLFHIVGIRIEWWTESAPRNSVWL